MCSYDEIRAVFTEHYGRYPAMQATDFLKLILHSASGCEHIPYSLERATGWVRAEYAQGVDDKAPLTVSVGGGYFRVYLSAITRGLSPDTLAKVFYLTARTSRHSISGIETRLAVLREMVASGEIALDPEELDSYIARWSAMSYPAIHHSDTFREAYRPAYRVVADRYVAILPTLMMIDTKMAKGDTDAAADAIRLCTDERVRKMLTEIYETDTEKREQRHH